VAAKAFVRRGDEPRHPGVLTGIGFLGAGVIVRRSIGKQVHG